jgi:hypothetical protein
VENLTLPIADTASWTIPSAALDPEDTAIHANVVVQRRCADVFVTVGRSEFRVLGSSAEQVGLAIVAAARGQA